jgi:glyoxylase-like metal-dependent hydrolase (beta-lactamase superfamily II)
LIKIKSFVFNYFSENTFIIWDDVLKECAVIDPGMSDAAEQNSFDEFIECNKLTPRYLINTHCHIDHILGCGYVKIKYNSEYFAPEKDLILLENARMQAGMFGLTIANPPKPDNFITEDLILELAETKLEFLFTPGHTPGEYCIYLRDQKICITGDVLFREGIGRTDLWGGNYSLLTESIKQKLFTLPDEVTIYPGHGELSTIGYEKKYNPFLIANDQ